MGALQKGVSTLFLAVISGFSAGWLVAGGVAALAPVLAHLLARRRGPEIVFPAAMFVRQALATHLRRQRLRDIALLVTRVAIVMTLALAFDQLVWRADAIATSDSEDGADVVLVMDQSASMTRTQLGEPLYDAARRRALTVLDKLDPGRDRAAVVFAAREAHSALPLLSVNIDALREQLRASEATLEKADVGGALKIAALLEGAGDDEGARSRRRQVVLYTDLQATQFSSDFVSDFSCDSCDLRLDAVGPSAVSDNLAITSVMISPAMLRVGEQAEAIVTIANFSSTLRSPTVQLRSPGGGALRTAPLIGPFASATVTFSIHFDSPGEHIVRAALRADEFPHDDEAVAIATVRTRLRIALLTRSSLNDSAAAARYVSLALAPDDLGAITVEAMHPDDVDDANVLDGFDACVIVEAEGLAPVTITALGAYAETESRAILWMADSQSATESLADFLATMGRARAFMSADVGNASYPFYEALGDDSPPLHLTLTDELSFTSDGTSALSQISFQTRSGLAPVALGRSLLSFQSGSPFAQSIPVGASSLVAVHASLAPGTSLLTRSPLFVQLIHELLRAGFMPLRTAAMIHPGERVSIRLAPDAALTPPVRVRSGDPVAIIHTRDAIELRPVPPSQPGVVEVIDSAGRLIAQRAVTLDPDESDFRLIALEDVRRMTSVHAEIHHDAEAGVEFDTALRSDHSTDVWPWLLVVALALFGVESALGASGRWAQRGHCDKAGAE